MHGVSEYDGSKGKGKNFGGYRGTYRLALYVRKFLLCTPIKSEPYLLSPPVLSRWLAIYHKLPYFSLHLAIIKKTYNKDRNPQIRC